MTDYNNFVLYCKSYNTDLKRLVRLAKSIQKFNPERIPFHVSVPQLDIPLFKENLKGLDVILLSDEDIIRASRNIDELQLKQMPGNLVQQVVKSEFWRLQISSAYLCLDSDAIFIRPFGLHDFIAPDGTPYTMIDEARDLLESALLRNRDRLVNAFIKEADDVQKIFQRTGKRYSFGPFPLVWHRSVWESLEKQFLQPNGMNFADAITLAPIESRWYGEALLKYQSIPLLPCQALFKVYHYAWQYDQDRRDGISFKKLQQLYCGVIFQSSWERYMDWPSEGGTLASRLGRRLRRVLGRI